MADNFTIDQIQRYYEVIANAKLRDLQLFMRCSAYASAYAFGSLKAEEFEKFIKQLDPDTREVVVDEVAKMKQMNFPVEDQ